MTLSSEIVNPRITPPPAHDSLSAQPVVLTENPNGALILAAVNPEICLDIDGLSVSEAAKCFRRIEDPRGLWEVMQAVLDPVAGEGYRNFETMIVQVTDNNNVTRTFNLELEKSPVTGNGVNDGETQYNTFLVGEDADLRNLLAQGSLNINKVVINFLGNSKDEQNGIIYEVIIKQSLTFSFMEETPKVEIWTELEYLDPDNASIYLMRYRVIYTDNKWTVIPSLSNRYSWTLAQLRDNYILFLRLIKPNLRIGYLKT